MMHRTLRSVLACGAVVVATILPARADVPIVIDHGSCSSPTVDVGSDGLARLAWISDESGSPRVYWGTYDRGGTCVVGPVEVGVTGYPLRPRIALDAQNRSFLVWVVGAGTINAIRFARVEVDGTVAVPEVNVSLGADGFQGIDIDTTADGYTHLITEHNESLHHPIYYSLLSPTGVPLGASPLELADQNWFFDLESYPSVGIGPDGKVSLAWFDRGTTSPTVSLYGARYTPMGARESWERLVYDVDPGQTTIARPEVGTLWLLFQNRASGVDRVAKYIGTNTMTVVSPPPGPQRRPRVAGKPGHPVVGIWEDHATGTARIRRNEWEATGAPLVEDGEVSVSSGAATSPDLGMNDDGLVYVAWVDTRHGRNDLYMTSFVGGDSNPWPYNPGPSITFRVDSDSGRVRSLCLRGEPPTNAITNAALAREVFVDPITVAVEDGFARFTVSVFANMPSLGDYDRVDLLGASGELLGHIGIEYDDTDANAALALDAYLYLHDGERQVDRSEHEFWGYYEADEFQVSMLVPPRGRFSAIGGSPKKPVLFVHGIEGYYRDWHDWGDTPDLVDPSKYDVWRFYYPYDQPIADSAVLFGQALDRLKGDTDPRLFGCSPYDEGIAVVAHSMGGLVARAHLQSDSNRGIVRKLAMFGTPNHGSYVSHRIRSSAEFGSTILAGLVDLFQLSDPFAPAHLDMAPASSFLLALDSRRPVRLGTASITTDYLTVAGVDVNVCRTPSLNLPTQLTHFEIEDQSDGVVSVSSANLRQYGIPLGIVKQDHQCMMWNDGPENEIERFLDDAVAHDWDTHYLECYLQAGSPTDCVEDAGADVTAGIVEIHVPQGFTALVPGVEPADSYHMDFTYSPLLRLLADDDVARDETQLVRALSGRDDYFTRTKRKWRLLDEIGLRAQAGSYRVGLYRKVAASDADDPWTMVGAATTPLVFAPMQTTVDSLVVEPASVFAMGAPHWSRPGGLGRRTESVIFDVDTDMKWVVFNLDTATPVENFAAHGLVLEDPQGRTIDPGVAATDPSVQYSSFDAFGPAQYTVLAPAPGTWIVRHAGTVPGARVTVFYDAEFSAVSRFARASVSEGDSLEFLTSVTGDQACVSSSIAASVDFTDVESGTTIPLGSLPLVEVSSGTYRGVLRDVGQGSYFVSVIATCDDGAGATLVRHGGANAGVQSAENDATGVDEVVPTVGRPRLDVHPNPFNATTEFTFEVSWPGRARLVVYTVAGQKVATVLDEVVGSERVRAIWDGRDDDGRLVATGVYLARVEAGGMVATRKVVLLK